MKIKKRVLITNLLVMFFLILCTFFHKVPVSSFVALTAFAGYLLYLLKRKTFIIFKYFAFLFSGMILIAGVAVSEFTTTYLYEINSISGFYGSLPAIIFFYYVFLTMLTIFDDGNGKDSLNLFMKKMKKNYAFINHCIAIVSTVVLFMQFVKIAKHPAFLLGYDRFQYAAIFGSGTGIWRIIGTLSYVVVLFPLIDFMNGHKICGASGVLFYVLYYLWNGNKFGPFLTLTCLFLLVYYKKIVVNRKLVKKIIPLVGLVVVMVVFMATFLSSGVMGVSKGAYLASRMAQQGQLWWKTYGLVGTTHISELDDEVDGIINGSMSIPENVDSHYGIYKIMYLCGDENYIKYKLSNGSRFTEAGYAAAYYYLGYLGAILFSVVSAFVIAKTMNLLVSSVIKGEFIIIAVITRLFILEREAMSLFIFGNFFDFISILSLCIIAVYVLLNKGLKKVKRYSLAESGENACG